MAAASNTFVCEQCLKINFHTLVTPVPPHKDRSSYFNETCCNYHYTQGCMVCDLLFRHTTLFVSTKDVLSIRSNPIARFQDDSMLGAEKSFFLSAWDGRNNNSAVMNTWCVPSTTAKNPMGLIWDHNKARTWLQECVEHHSLCDLSDTVPMDISLIDCLDMTIVEANASSRWIALSYVWGLRPQTSVAPESTRIKSLRLPPDLPRTIHDAIMVTQQLGYRYLWVDEYCIDKSDEFRREAQIARTDEVYRGADLTIVAAAGENKNYGLPGVNNTPRKRIKVVSLEHATLFANPDDLHDRIWNSKWFTRAWTLQEGFLSRRALLFTDYQSLLYCSTGCFTEGLGEFLSTVHTGRTQVTAGGGPLGQARASLPARRHDLEAARELANFLRLTSLYSTRDFTFDNDALNAFRGIIRYVRNTRPDAYHLCGLPFFTAFCAEDKPPWTHDLIDSMFWFHNLKSRSPERRPSFPSWSWTGWKRAVIASPMDLMSKRSLDDHTNRSWTFLQVHLNKIQLETLDGDILAMDTLWGNGTPDEIQGALDIVAVISFTAPVVPADTLLTMIDTFHNQSINFQWCPLRDELVTKMRSGEWSCLLLSYKQSDPAYGDEKMATLLIVKWEDDQVAAERVTLYFVCADGNDAFSKPPDLDRRRVRLV